MPPSSSRTCRFMTPNLTLDFWFRNASGDHVTPANQALVALRKSRPRQPRCQAITSRNPRSRCKNRCLPLGVHLNLAYDAIGDGDPPYPPKQAINILTLLLCRRHLPDERYWTHVFFNLVDSNVDKIAAIKKDFLADLRLAVSLPQRMSCDMRINDRSFSAEMLSVSMFSVLRSYCNVNSTHLKFVKACL